MHELSGQLVTETGLTPVVLSFDERIIRIEQTDHAPAQVILPGVLDWHNHGGGGGDVMDGESGIRALARTHVQFGMTGFLATTVTASDADIEAVLEATAHVMAHRAGDEARCHGVHLEGPYLSDSKLGAQPPNTRMVDADRVASWFGTGIVRVMTYAPEQDPEGILPSLARAHNVRLQLGHSGCTYAQASRLLSAGHGVTHLFNAMSGVHHREPGLALAGLSCAHFSEIICDGLHVTEPAFALARRSIPELYAVTDATSASGMADGAYRLGSHSVEKRAGAVRLADGTLAGSAATAETTVSTLRAFGLSWSEIMLMTSKRPAKWLGLDADIGLQPGHPADFVVYQDARLANVWMSGQSIFTEVPATSASR